MTGIILILAANTAFNGFPVLGSILARDGFMPRALGSRGDRLAYSNGILVLAGFAVVLIVAFDAQTTRLIQLYIVGVFVSFNLSQLGMIRHWTRHLKTETDLAKRRHMMRSRGINTFGLCMTAVVFVVILLTKFLAGAWIAILSMVVFFAIMKAIRRHYDNVSRELAADDEDRVLPTKVHAIVLVCKLHKPTLRALAYAKASRPNVLEAVYVAADDKATKELMQEWDERNLGVPLKVLYSPYREIVRPIIDYATQIRRANPRGVVAVYIPEYVVGRWWEQLLHNQTALRLKGRLLFTPGVMVTSVPYQPLLADREGPGGARPRAGQGRRPAPRHLSPGARSPPRGQVPRDRLAALGSATPHAAGAGRPEPPVGERFEAEVGPVAHGGHCVVRHDDRVVSSGTPCRGKGLVGSPRAARVTVLAWRRVSIRDLAGPGGARVRTPARACGGCDFQHVDPGASGAGRRRWSVSSSRAWPGSTSRCVEEVPPSLRWRTRMRYVALPSVARGCTSTAPTRSSPSTTARSTRRAIPLVGRAKPRPARPSPRRTARTTSRSPPTASGSPTSRHRGCWWRRARPPRAQPGEWVLDLYAGVGLSRRSSPTRLVPRERGLG